MTMSLFAMLAVGTSPIWMTMLFILGPIFLNWLSEFQRERFRRSLGSRREQKPQLWSAVELAHWEHVELSPEFFVWARTNHTLDHPPGCQYCLDDYRKANERIQDKVSTKLLNKIGFEYTNEEIWAAWMKHDAKQLRKKAG